MLVTLKEILAIAEEKNIAVGAFNCPNLEALEGIIDAAEELDLPVIIQFAQGHQEIMDIDRIGPIMMIEAKRAKVPVCCHLDHGEDLEYVKKALDLGFTGVMFDGSTLPYEENVEKTRKAVEMAHAVGASVEVSSFFETIPRIIKTAPAVTRTASTRIKSFKPLLFFMGRTSHQRTFLLTVTMMPAMMKIAGITPIRMTIHRFFAPAGTVR